MLHKKDDTDCIPSKTREMQVLYYDVMNKMKVKNHPNITSYKPPVYGHPKEPEYKMYMRQTDWKFDSFDDAVEFLDNLGDDNILIEIANLLPQINIYSPKKLYFDSLIDDKNHIYMKKIYTNKELFDERVSEHNKIVGQKFSLHVQFVKKYCTTWF